MKDDLVHISHISDALNKIVEYTSGMTIMILFQVLRLKMLLSDNSKLSEKLRSTYLNFSEIKIQKPHGKNWLGYEINLFMITWEWMF